MKKPGRLVPTQHVSRQLERAASNKAASNYQQLPEARYKAPSRQALEYRYQST